MLEKLQNVFSNAERKNIFQMSYEFIRCSFSEKEIAWYYFTRLLYRKEIDNYLDYIGFKKGNSIQGSDEINNIPLRNILDNKVMFSNYLKDSNIKIPKTLGYNFKNNFFVEGKKININNYSDFNELIKGISQKEHEDSIFVKPIMGMKGDGCFKLNSSNCEKEIFDAICTSNYIIQQSIIQHEDINNIYSHSVNPIRIFTYIDENKKVHILPSFITFARDSNEVSNASNNSIFVNIDVDTGILNDYGYSYLQYGGNKFFKHPDTNTLFKGFKIPYFEESKIMVIEATKYIPYKLIGWDVAITPGGPIIIEGNGRGSLASIDISYGGLKRHPVFKKILEEYT